jgi:ribonuclease D
LREVYQWREGAAAKRNRPARTVLRDDLLVEIAKRVPKQEEEITSLRGVGRVDLAGLMDAIDRARRVPESEWPEEVERENDPHAVSLVASLLNVVLADWCAREELTTPLVATSADVRRLVRAAANGDPPPEDSALTSGWRKEHVLPVLQEVLDGRRALRVKSLEGDAPLEYGHVRPK